MTIEEMKSKKIEYGLTNEQLSRSSGVPVGTIRKIFAGITTAPRQRTIEAIERALTEETGRRNYLSGSSYLRSSSYLLKEPEPAYNADAHEDHEDRRYTTDDYYALPDDVRTELIDGVFYDMESPSLIHQMILGELYILFRECADRHDMPCDVWLSPGDVRLNRDKYTMVQPDLFIFCRSEYEDTRAFEGAPDLTVEILSPSSRSKDMFLKLYKYQNAGVREYWIVDPKNRTVTVHYFESEDYDPQKYTFSDTVPIRISGGTCGIDFSVIQKKLDARKW